MPNTRDLAKELWKLTLDNYKSSLITEEDIKGFTTWLSSTEGFNFTPEAFTISVPSKFFGDFVSAHYGNPLKIHLKQAIHKLMNMNIVEIDLQFHFKKEKLERVRVSDTFRLQNIPNIAISDTFENNHNKNIAFNIPTQLKTKYTFDHFVVGSGNKHANAAALAIAKKPGITYNPFFIYGDVGLGKTHLMQAIGHYVKNQAPNTRVYYASSERFTNEMIQAIQKGKMEEFRQKYRTIDILMIDDIQFLEGKESTQEEFFHTFNTLHDSNKQIILTSDRPPKELKTLEKRLVSRFTWGLITDIKKPDYETRVAILQKKLEEDMIKNFSPEVIAFVAKYIKSNIRELEGAIVKIQAESSVMNKEITVEFTKTVLKDFINTNGEVNMNRIIEIVCKFYNVNSTDLISKKRTADIAWARQVCMYLTRELTEMSLIQIASRLGKKDHSTIIHAEKKVRKSINESQKTNDDLEEIKNML